MARPVYRIVETQCMLALSGGLHVGIAA